MKCLLCEKKIKISAYACKCGNYYCRHHSEPEKHDCTFDYLNEHKKILELKNPIITSVKI